MQTKKRVLIIGAGPAGLSAAIELAEDKNFDVIILEKNQEPSYKVCAGGVDSQFFQKFVSEDILDRNFNKFYIQTPKVLIPVEGKEEIFIGTLNRQRLNEKLTQKAQTAGAQVLFGKNVAEIKDNSVRTDAGEEFPFDYLIGADGSNSIVRRKMGLKSNKVLTAFQYMIPGNYENLEIFIDPKKFGVTYFWIFPQKDIISVGTGYCPSKYRKDFPISKLREVFEIWCKERFDLTNARFEGHTINYDYKGFDFGNIFLAGDAGGFTSGLTGEGIKPAMLSGQDIAKKIKNPEYECPEIKKILAIKRKEETILDIAQNNYTGPIIFALCSLLIRFSWGRKLVLKFV